MLSGRSRMENRPKARAGVVAAALVALGMMANPSLIAAETGGPSTQLEVMLAADGRVSVELGDVALSEVLVRITKYAGAELVIEGDVGRARPQAFVDLPMAEAIRRLVGRNSFMLKFVPADDGASAPRLSLIAVYGSARPARAELPNRTDDRSLQAAGSPVPHTAHRTPGPPAPAVVGQVRSYAAFAKLDRQSRLQAIGQLAWSGDAGFAILGQIVTAEKDRGVRRAAVATLAHGPNNVVQRTLYTALADAEPGVRLEAVRGIAGDKGATSTAKLALAATHDADALVRRIAVIALAGTDSRTTRAALRRALQDPDFAVRDAAQRVLARLDYSSKTG